VRGLHSRAQTVTKQGIVREQRVLRILLGQRAGHEAEGLQVGECAYLGDAEVVAVSFFERTDRNCFSRWHVDVWTVGLQSAIDIDRLWEVTHDVTLSPFLSDRKWKQSARVGTAVVVSVESLDVGNPLTRSAA
jgi:hypothetical protein